MDTEAGVDADGDPAYLYRPSLIGAAWEFRLRPDAIEWRMGRHHGRAPYAEVVRVRLSFRPQTMQARRFVTEVWPAGGPKLTIASTSWRGMLEQATQDAAYGAFVRELHARLAAAGAAAPTTPARRRCSTGRGSRCSPPPARRWRGCSCMRSRAANGRRPR